jgi:hypothetical protein
MKMFTQCLNSRSQSIDEDGITIDTSRLLALDPELKSSEAARFEAELRARVVGQERAVRKLASVCQVFQAGMTGRLVRCSF